MGDGLIRSAPSQPYVSCLTPLASVGVVPVISDTCNRLRIGLAERSAPGPRSVDRPVADQTRERPAPSHSCTSPPPSSAAGRRASHRLIEMQHLGPADATGVAQLDEVDPRRATGDLRIFKSGGETAINVIVGGGGRGSAASASPG